MVAERRGRVGGKEARGICSGRQVRMGSTGMAC